MTSFRSALVTGATGFLGSALVSRLVKEHVTITCLVREKQRSFSLADVRGVRLIKVPSFQTSHLESHLADVSAEVVFNLASYGVHQQDRDSDELINGIGLLCHLLKATRTWPLVRFVHVGSCSEYGAPASPGTPISEGQSLRPLSIYGAAKAAAFLLGCAYSSQLQTPFIALRLFGAFGPHEAPHRLIPYLIDRLQTNRAVDLTGGEQVRDFLFEDDVVEALLQAPSAALTSEQVYNVCSSRPVLIRELGETVAGALNKPSHLLHWGERPYRTDEPMWLVGDNRRFVNVTSWRPRISLEEGIHRMICHRQITCENNEQQHAI
jgi:nucleoside-diphosphate-sugar epimerase